MQGIWEGDWPARAEQAAKKLGFVSLWELAIEFPAVPYRDLAESLNANLVALQIEQYLRAQAFRRKKIAFFARDCLVRKIRQHVTKGWMTGPRPDFDAARAYGAWIGALGQEFSSQARKIWAALRNDPDLRTGWLPEGPHDPVILRAFSGIHFDVGE